jgi:hypothetical protein
MKVKTCGQLSIHGEVSMHTTLIVATLAVFAMDLGIGSHLAQRAARKVVSEAVQEGLGDAIREAALSATLDAVADNAAAEFADRAGDIRDDAAGHDFGDIHDAIDLGAAASNGVEAAMRAADVASKLDDVADAANAVKKLGKLKKLRR